jgi:hypothetical protein
MNLLERVLGEDKSDLANSVKETALASLADPEIKERVWKELTDLESKESIYARSAKMGGFYDWR